VIGSTQDSTLQDDSGDKSDDGEERESTVGGAPLRLPKQKQTYTVIGSISNLAHLGKVEEGGAPPPLIPGKQGGVSSARNPIEKNNPPPSLASRLIPSLLGRVNNSGPTINRDGSFANHTALMNSNVPNGSDQWATLISESEANRRQEALKMVEMIPLTLLSPNLQSGNPSLSSRERGEDCVPEWVESVIDASDKQTLKNALLESDIILYDLMSSYEEAEWALQFLNEETASNDHKRVFIGLSSLLTWGNTKTSEDSDPSNPISEEEYRRRKPHPLFKNQLAVEKVIIKLQKPELLQTYIVNSGVRFGPGCTTFEWILKSAWESEETSIKLFGDENMIIPTIHIEDLAQVTLRVAERKPSTRYLIAADGSHSRIGEIVQVITITLISIMTVTDLLPHPLDNCN